MAPIWSTVGFTLGRPLTRGSHELLWSVGVSGAFIYRVYVEVRSSFRICGYRPIDQFGYLWISGKALVK